MLCVKFARLEMQSAPLASGPEQPWGSPLEARTSLSLDSGSFIYFLVYSFLVISPKAAPAVEHLRKERAVLASLASDPGMLLASSRFICIGTSSSFLS